MVKAKICGITNAEDALAAVEAGCDALGFAFFRKSPRFITPSAAAKIIRLLPRKVISIGVFVNAPEKRVKAIARLCGLKMLQFHGQESPAYCKRFGGYKIIKTFHMSENFDGSILMRYPIFAYLFDTFQPGKLGGTGKTFDWRLMRHISWFKKPIFLSGGLSARNVAQAVRTVKPQWVDACSLLELAPGKKNKEKVRRFIKAAKGVR